jgi:hypothetical protein
MPHRRSGRRRKFSGKLSMVQHRRTWKPYVALLEAELNVDAALLAYCPNPSIAHRYRTLFDADGHCLSLATSIGPVLHPDDAVANKMRALYGRAEARDFVDVDAAEWRDELLAA